MSLTLKSMVSFKAEETLGSGEEMAVAGWVEEKVLYLQTTA